MDDFRRRRRSSTSYQCKNCPQNKNAFEVEEIVTTVLLKLPVKCLLICKSVCKYWRSLICSPSFKCLHLIQCSQETPSYIACHYRWGKIRCKKDERRTVCSYYHSERIHLLTKVIDDGETTQILPNGIGFYFKGMICSFNGLVCCINRNITSRRRRCNCGHEKVYGLYRKYFSITIRNPATQLVFSLPQAPQSECPNHNCQSTLGVSFHSTINAYKVFQFFSREKRPYQCMMYSSITGSWKSIATGAVAPGPPLPKNSSSNNHVCINGTVYWFWKSILDGQLVGYVLAVDWEETFSIIRIPEEEKTIKAGVLGNLEGSLSIVVVTKDGPSFQHRFDIWVLEDSKESVWVKKLSDYISFSTTDSIRCVVVRINEILFGTRKQYSLYNIHTRSWRVFNWACGPYWCFSPPLAYTESLFPCNGRNIDS